MSAFIPLAQAADSTAAGGVQLECELVAEVRRDPLAPLDGPPGSQFRPFVPATHLSQGDVVYYTLRIRNPSIVYAAEVMVVQKIPANTAYVAGSAAAPGAQVEFSIDGGQSFAVPRGLQVTDEGGTRLAPPERYTHIRWQLRHPLAPGAVALARFQAIFN
ncbi:hypothetical protein ACG33_09760 [Steroidobacter denitrificans]|uniref:DUF11 domain-containing protein n=1 Tax=Steroidobacter denitrificans TaxID=465721 RepID=A0A127FAD6_STEDE|nr:DUF11 domain-containing protein [Steroidobacter denitrificans]AMN47377.1 hypothetical protein ACG33_09760 [Steroidobacter denitrificans]